MTQLGTACSTCAKRRILSVFIWTALLAPRLVSAQSTSRLLLTTTITTNNIKSAVTDWVTDSVSATTTFGDISDWDISAVTSLHETFASKTSFNENIGGWDTSAVTSFYATFYSASIFNQNIGEWSTSALSDFRRTFYKADAFNQNIGGWDTSAVNTLVRTFHSAAAFDHNIGGWNTSAVTSMDYAFYMAENFNQYIGRWDNAATTSFQSMFYGAAAFNQALCWDTSNAISSSMFSSSSGSTDPNAAKCSCTTGQFYNVSICASCPVGEDSYGKSDTCFVSPTPAPTPALSYPSQLPSWDPTSSPSVLPSLEPFPLPTPAPTIVCYPGQYYIVESNLCAPCDAGKFANVSMPPWPSDCQLCKSGTYTSQIGSISCNACPVGKFSSGERTGCVTCSAGQYTFNKTSCVDCELGWYAPQALSGTCFSCIAGSHTNMQKRATTCTPCNAGSFSSAQSANCTLCAIGHFSGSGTSICTACGAGKAAEKPGAFECASCQAGRFSLTEAKLCERCPAGKSSTAGSQICSSCSAGYYSASKGSLQCIACAAGSYSSTTASVSCSSCAPGTAQGATGQPSCIACSAGTYSESYGEPYCSSCPGDSFSYEQASSCNWCLKDYFFSDGSCLLCPAGTICDVDGASTLGELLIQPGWWRISEESDRIRQCTHGSLACEGGLSFNAGYCTGGHEGILCAVCSDGYYFNPEESECIFCDELPSAGQIWLSSPALILFSIIIFIYLGFILSISCISNRSAANKRRQRSVWMEQLVDRLTEVMVSTRDLLSYMSGSNVKLKALTSFFQIAQNIGFNCNVSFSATFRAIIRPFRMLNLDILPSLGLACRIDNYDYVDTLVIATLGPLFFAVLLVFIFGLETIIRRLKTKRLEAILRKDERYAIPDYLVLSFASREISNFRWIFVYFEKDANGTADVSQFLLFEGKPELSFGQYMYIIQQAHLNDRQGDVLNFIAAAEAKANARQGETIVFILLFFSFIVLVGTSSTIFGYFQCTTFQEVKPAVRFLAHDYSLNCASPQYRSHVVYAVAMLLVYPIGIPLTYFVLLKRHQEIISCPVAMKHEADMGNPKIEHLVFLIEAYKPEYWWFEIVECFRRLLLASVIGIASGDSALAPVLGFLLCLAFLHLFGKRPYNKDDDNTLGIVMTYSLAFIFLGALLIHVDAQPNGELERNLFEAVLIFLLFMGPGLIISNALQSSFVKLRKHFKKEQSAQNTDRRNMVDKCRRRRRKKPMPFVRSVDPKVKTHLPDTSPDNSARALQDAPFTMNAEGTRPWITNPFTTVEEGLSSRERFEVSPMRPAAEDGVELQGVKKEHAL